MQEEVKQTQSIFTDEAKAQMTVKEFQNLCLSLIRSNAANKDIIKAIMLESNFEINTKQGFSRQSNSVMRCRNDCRSDKGLTSMQHAKLSPSSKLQDGYLAPVQLKPSKRFHLLPRHTLPKVQRRMH